MPGQLLLNTLALVLGLLELALPFADLVVNVCEGFLLARAHWPVAGAVIFVVEIYRGNGFVVVGEVVKKSLARDVKGLVVAFGF